MSTAQKNFIIYDADCGFCQNSVDRLEKITGDLIEYKPRLSFKDGEYGVDHEDSNSSIKFVEFVKSESEKEFNYHKVYKNYTVYSASFAVFKAVSCKKPWDIFLGLYKYFPLFGVISEAGYRVIARHRGDISSACKVPTPKI